ncbi:MAG: hypothetical protein V3R74_07350 [Alphaproteobacteria bacterium]
MVRCDFVQYNVRPPGGGLAGLAEFDVVGFDFGKRTVYLAEVSTHLDGLNYGSYQKTLDRITRKFERQRDYARQHLADFSRHRFMFWSPRVAVGFLTDHLSEIDGLELVINGAYSKRVDELRELARNTTRDTGNPFFRSLQILARLRS